MSEGYNDNEITNRVTTEYLNSSVDESTPAIQVITSSIGVGNTDTLILPNVESKEITRTFGRTGDYIELHIYNSNGEKVHSNHNFKDFTSPDDGNEQNELASHISLDPKKVLSKAGYTSGKFKLKLNILRNKIFNSIQPPFNVKEISPKRREIKTTAPNASNEALDPSVGEFISEIESSVYFKEFSLNFGNDVLIPCLNILLDKSPFKHEVLFKSLNPVSSAIGTGFNFKVVEEISNPSFIDVDLGTAPFKDDSIDIGGPNFFIDIKLNNSVPSGFKSYDELLSYDITSSYQHLLSRLEDDGAKLDIVYDYIRPVSESSEDKPYHFENFTHFSSAVERVKNFKYKLNHMRMT